MKIRTFKLLSSRNLIISNAKLISSSANKMNALYFPLVNLFGTLTSGMGTTSLARKKFLESSTAFSPNEYLFQLFSLKLNVNIKNHFIITETFASIINHIPTINTLQNINQLA